MSKTNAWDKWAKFTADFETTYHKEFTATELIEENKDSGDNINFTPNESSQMFLAGVRMLYSNQYRVSYEDMVDFISNIANMTYTVHKKKALVWFHNLAYDGDYVLKWLIKNGWKQCLKVDEVTKAPILLRKQFALLKSGGKFFSLEFWWRGIYIKFVDSLKLLPFKLADLGEQIGYKKLSDTVDYKEFEIRQDHNYPKHWLDYLERDCEISAKYLELFFETEPKAKTTRRQTIGSIAYSYIKRLIEEHIPDFTIKDYYFWEYWCHGGLCFPSLKYWGKWVFKKQRIKMIDRVSMYPTQMIKPLPYGKPLHKPPKNASYCTFYHILIKDAVIKQKYSDIACIWKPFEMVNHKKVTHFTKFNSLYSYIQEVENEQYWVCDCEFEIWKQLYDIKYEIIDTFYFTTAPFLSSVIYDMFKDKKNAQNNVSRTRAKLKINSAYGKIGQKPLRPSDFYGKEEDIDLDKYEILGKKNGILGGFIVQQKKLDTDPARPIFLAAYITALARTDLLAKYKQITDIGGTFLYCDTDSICYVDKIKPIEFNDIGSELGQWEFEKFKVADAFCSLCPKQYRIAVIGNDYPVKFACAGCKKEHMAEVKNIDYNYDLGDNKKYNIKKTQLKDDINGKTIWDTSFNFIKYKKIMKNPKLPKELKNG